MSDEPMTYSPMSATTAAVELFYKARHQYGDDYKEIRALTEICYVINALANMLGCPGNTSVEDFRLEHTRSATADRQTIDSTGSVSENSGDSVDTG